MTALLETNFNHINEPLVRVVSWSKDLVGHQTIHVIHKPEKPHAPLSYTLNFIESNLPTFCKGGQFRNPTSFFHPRVRNPFEHVETSQVSINTEANSRR